MRHRRAILLLLLAASGRIAHADGLAPGTIVAPHPMAAEAGGQILHAGGNATDAAIAAQMMLAVVEPQSSGLGGGSVLLAYDAASQQVTSWDGKEAAPAGATPELFVDPRGGLLPPTGGRAVGVPGTVKMLEALHQEKGHLPWSDLLAPAIRAAEAGVPVSPALAEAIAARADQLRQQPAARALFFTPDGAPLAAGSTLVNPALGQTLRAIAANGAAALMHGPIAADIATTVRTDPEPGLLTTDDLAAYIPRRRAAICRPYRDRMVCTAAVAGGPQMLEALGLLGYFDLAAQDPKGAGAAQLLIEAERLAVADRLRYLADPEFVAFPLPEMLDGGYLAPRAKMIRLDQAMAAVQAGNPVMSGSDGAAQRPQPEHGTSTVAVVDGTGNAVSLTSSVGPPFGAGLVVHGFLLNAALGDFSPRPAQDGRPVANRVQPGKRPATSMTPAMVMDTGGRLVAVLGSAGGESIPAYLVQAVAALVDWRMDPADAVALLHVAGTAEGAVVEAPWLVPDLSAKGQQVHQAMMRSGTAVIELEPHLAAAADPRRSGAVVGR